jgi:dTDP-4-dehydrorhamnose 3,5-epimerase
MEVKPTLLSGCYEIQPKRLDDQRGCFVKIFHQELFAKRGLVTNFAEEYYSVSKQGVLRGLHFQLPPHEHTKLVYCVDGQVLDAVVDIRRGSPTYGQFVTFDLNAKQANMIYITPGLAHGFYVISESATLIYKVTTVYAPRHDTGIRWDSLGIPWPTQQPLISERDSQLPTLSNFENPFVFEVSKVAEIEA